MNNHCFLKFYIFDIISKGTALAKKASVCEDLLQEQLPAWPSRYQMKLSGLEENELISKLTILNLTFLQIILISHKTLLGNQSPFLFVTFQ